MAQNEAIRVQGDDMVDYTPGTDVPEGEVVVQGDLIGVALSPLPANQLGAVAVSGVFEIKKTSGQAISAGALVYWDNTNRVATTTSTGNKLLGKATKAAAGADATVLVRLSM